MRKRRHLLGTGDLAAHRRHRLMLLGSPPDMVHGFRLRETHPSTQVIRRADHTDSALIKGIHPCCSGLQVQGTANSPAGMALFYSLSICFWGQISPTLIYYIRFFPKLQEVFEIFRTFAKKFTDSRGCSLLTRGEIGVAVSVPEPFIVVMRDKLNIARCKDSA